MTMVAQASQEGAASFYQFIMWEVLLVGTTTSWSTVPSCGWQMVLPSNVCQMITRKRSFPFWHVVLSASFTDMGQLFTLGCSHQLPDTTNKHFDTNRQSPVFPRSL